MSSDSINVVRERIISNYRQAGAKETPEPKTPKEVPKEFLDEVQADEGAVMYSEFFPGAKKYLADTGKPDFDLSVLVHSEMDWKDEDKTFIPTVDEHYQWQHDVLYPAILALLGKMKVLFVGPTGSGKTTFHENLAGMFQQPFYRLGGRGDMESDTILGRQDIQGGSMDFLLGEFTKSYVKGYYILLDEIWKLPSNINMTFQRVFERGGLLQIDDARGELADKQFMPEVRTILTLADNVVGTGDGADKYAATMIQDGSTINRMDMVLKIGYLEPKQEISMLMSRFGQFLPEHMAQKTVQVAGLVRNGFEQGEISATMSPRNLIAWLEMAQKVRSYEESFKWVMLQRYADDTERSAISGFYSTVFGKTL